MTNPYMAEKLMQFEQIRVERAAREYWKVHASQEQPYARQIETRPERIHGQVTCCPC